MKNYSLWMSQSTSYAEESVFDLCATSKVKINNSLPDYDVIVNDANEWQKDVDNIFLIKKSIYTINHGDVITYNGQNYLVFFVPEDRDFYVSAKARLCNETLILSGTKTEIVTGQTPFGDDIVEIVEGTPISIPCITKSTLLTDRTDEAINLPQGRLDVSIPYTEHVDLVLSGKFNMYGEQYNIIEIDKTKQIDGVGLLVIQGKKV